MKIVVMGTGPFAVPTCQALLDMPKHQIRLVVTRPLAEPRPKKLPPRPVFEWATAAGLPIFEPQDINDASSMDRLREIDADLFFVCDYGQILSQACLSTTRLGGINLHGSVLPRHRGAAPVQWTILRGDAEAGVTVIHMTPKLDAGPSLAVVTTSVKTDETSEQLEPRLAQLGVSASLKAIELLEHWDGHSEIGALQDKAQVTRAPRFSKADGQLDFRLPADYLVRLIRACQPWPGTFAELHRPAAKGVMRVKLHAARHTTLQSPAQLAPGDAWATTSQELQLDWPEPWDKLIAVATGQGTLLIRSLQPAGKREMQAEEFLRGYPLSSGCHFLLPEIQLPMLTEA